jgi:hypothetical protein
MTQTQWASCLECRAMTVSVGDHPDLLWDPTELQRVELIRAGVVARVDLWRTTGERVQVHLCCGRRFRRLLEKIRDVS